MDLTFRIIWFEDVDEWYKTTSRRIAKYIRDKNYKVDIVRVERASDFNLSEHEVQNYDLLIVDYELEKIYDQDGETRIYGTEIIQMIRNGSFVNDVLFYSSHGFDIINMVMKENGLQGVFIADRDNGEFVDVVKRLIDKAVRRADNLVNIRGVVMDTTSDFDNKIRDLISLIWKTLGDNEQKIARDIKKKILGDNVKTAQKLNEKYPDVNESNINDLLNERDFSATRQARLLSWCIDKNEDKLKQNLLHIFSDCLNLGMQTEKINFFELYNKEIIKYRNALAHVKTSPEIDSKVIIGEIDGEVIEFDRQLCDELRKRLLQYERALDGMYKYIESNC